MTEVRTMKIRLYPNKTQERILLSTLSHCCTLYDHLLEICRDAYANGEKIPSKYDMDHTITGFKKEHPELKEAYSQVLTNVSTRVSLAFKGYFRRLKAKQKAGFPRFRSESRYDSFSYTQKGFSLTDGRLELSKIGSIRCAGIRKMFGELKTCTVKRRGHAPHYRWEACLTYSYDECTTLSFEDSRDMVGIDLGLTDVITISDGRKIPNDRAYAKAERTIARHQRRMAKYEKGTEQYNKHEQRLFHALTHLKDARRAERYDTVNGLIGSNSIIAVEDLDVRRLMEKSLNKDMRKSYRDAGWRMLLDTLCTKAAEAGCTVVRVDPAYTSQQCSYCGRMVQKDLSERRHVCTCGLDIDRDVNSARNILRLGLQALQSENC